MKKYILDAACAHSVGVAEPRPACVERFCWTAASDGTKCANDGDRGAMQFAERVGGTRQGNLRVEKFYVRSPES